MVMTARDAAALDLASSKGRPRLVLRGQDDQGPVGFARLTLAELVGEQVVSDSADGDTAKPQAVNDAGSHAADERVSVLAGHGNVDKQDIEHVQGQHIPRFGR